MSQATVAILLPQTAYNGVDTITGNAIHAASYYLSSQNLQTLSWSVTNFTGNITINASLADTPGANDWFVAYAFPAYNNITKVNYYNLYGNFVWLQVNINNFVQGQVDNIKVSY
jgi:hypothetical protein